MDNVENIILNIGGFLFKMIKDVICRLLNFIFMLNKMEYLFDCLR